MGNDNLRSGGFNEPLTLGNSSAIWRADRLSTQAEVLLAYLKKGNEVTAKVAIVTLGIRHLSKAVTELRNHGHSVLDQWTHIGKGTGQERYYKRYWLADAAA